MGTYLMLSLNGRHQISVNINILPYLPSGHPNFDTILKHLKRERLPNLMGNNLMQAEMPPTLLSLFELGVGHKPITLQRVTCGCGRE